MITPGSIAEELARREAHRKPAPLEVQETGDRLRYYVHSERNPKKVYLVDLLALGGNGECSCRNFSCERWPIVRDGGRSICKHIAACRTHFLNQLLEHMARNERTKEDLFSTVAHPHAGHRPQPNNAAHHG